MRERKVFEESQVKSECLKYFKGDELATNVFMSKYCLRDLEGNYYELTPDDMHKRLAAEFARVEAGTQNALSQEDIYKYLKDFKYIVPQGSPMFGIGNDFVLSSLSNCVVVSSPEDNVSSICNSGRDLANLFKRRCGVGLDISHLRPDGATVNNSARTTTGAWSFADFYSYVCRMIGQNGRRGALMISMDVSHPDIEMFIEMKHDLTKVTGANVSVKITDDFMEAVTKDQPYVLSWTSEDKTSSYMKTVRAKDIWDKIVKSATETAEPGILMWDNIRKNLPAEEYDQFKTICTNPCAEIPLSAYDSCRLISMNLKHLVENPFEESAYFNFEKLKEIVRVGMRLSDDLVELELEKIEEISLACDTQDEKELWAKLHSAAANGRRTGLGTHGLADCLSRLNMPYDSNEAIEFLEELYETVRNVAYQTSVNLARERGAFPVWDKEVEKENEFLLRLPSEIQAEMRSFGRRNISILTNAPTGSVSIMSQTSSGIEPVFRNSYTRRRKLNHDELGRDADFIDDLGDKWINFEVFHHNAQEYLDLHPETDVLPKFFVESDGINWEKRVDIQSVIQKYIDHSISSTINLPMGTKPEVVGSLYEMGWKKGLKGITVYVDGSRSGVLITNDSKEEGEKFPQHSAPKRPEELECEIHNIRVKDEDWMVMVGLVDGKPYEVIGGLSENIEIPKSVKRGMLRKVARKTKSARYDLSTDSGLVIRDVVKIFDNYNNEVLTRMISLSLRHGTSVSHVVEQLKKDKNSDMFSFSRSLSRVLKKYIQDGTEASSEHCPTCESKRLIYQDGCVQCQECGWSGCS